jgi:O-antigen chain-terminating methyltransferase
MFVRNNPNIDFDALEKEVTSRIESYKQTGSHHEMPEFDPERLEKARIDMTRLQHTNVEGGLNLLYSLEDRDFVYYAYNFFLGRPPTEREAASCTERLRSGENKTRIACELRYSEEGKGRNEDVSLRKEFIAYKLISLPVIGKVFDILSIIASLPVLKAVSQAETNHQYRLMDSLKSDINRKNQQLGELSYTVRENEKIINELRTELDDALAAVASSRARLSLLEQKHSPTTGTEALPTLPKSSEYTDDSLYVAFEEKYRGSPGEIRERLGRYLPIIESALGVKEMEDKGKVVDIGCGRGEWLSLLEENGYKAIGIDTNIHNINFCREKDLTAFHEDAIQWLSLQQDESLDCVSAFHVIEHLDFSQLNFFLDHALRSLRQGGLLLLETPNPENLLVGTNAFYLDPTHVRPIPAGLMDFLLSYKGFHQVEVQKIHPVAHELMIHEDTEVARRCNQLFYEGQDYAIIGIKP